MASILQAEFLEHRRRLHLFVIGHQGVDHGIAGEMDALLRSSFRLQVVDAALLCDEEMVGDAVREDAVDLLRHAEVAATEAAFEMPQGDAHLIGHQRTGKGAVHIPGHDHQVRPHLCGRGLQGDHDMAHLGGRAGLWGIQKVVRQQAELIKEDGAHLLVIMLAGMHQLYLHAAFGGHRLEAGHLDEIRARAHHHHQLLHL